MQLRKTSSKDIIPGEIAQSCLELSEWAAKFGSPMYAGLSRLIANDVRSGGPCLYALEPYVVRTYMLAPQLLLAGVHRMVLEGCLPKAARFYPSAGGLADVDALWPNFLEAVPLAVLPASVQMNDVRRSYALLPGFLEVIRTTGLPLRLLEIGASAGLNLRWDHFPFLSVPPMVRIVERRGCDLNPIDPALAESRPALLCYIWPDLTDRFQQLDVAIGIARRVPAPVDRSDAIPWLQTHLAEPRQGVATVVFHSFFMPFLTQSARERVGRIIAEAGQRAKADAAVTWLSMESADGQCDVHLTMWPGGERRLIARAGVDGKITVLRQDSR